MKLGLSEDEFDYTVPLLVAFSGWLVLLAYLYYCYIQYRQDIVTLLFSGTDTARIGTFLILVAPLVSSILGFALSERLKMYRTDYLEQMHFKTLFENELRETLDRLILCFVNALDSKSPWTKGHSLRVQHYCLMIARELKLPEEQVEQLSIAALLHDIGKIGTYDDILNKLEDLTPNEYAMIKKHPGNAVSILEPIPQFSALLPIIKGHHERLDGRGYPDGLKGTQIPLLARILCVADAYDAITSERPYKESMGLSQGITEVQRSSGVQFDPAIVQALVEAHKKPEFCSEALAPAAALSASA